MSAPNSPNLVGLLFLAMVVTIALTPILSLLVLRRYRRAVRRSMHATAPGSGQPAIQTMSSEGRGHVQPRPGGASAPVLNVPGESRPELAGDGPWWPLARQRMRSLCYVYVAAGLANGLVAAIVSLKVLDVPVVPRLLAVLVVVFAWPVVPTVLAVLAASRLTTALVWISYLLLVLLLFVGTSIPIDVILELILLTVLPAAILLYALIGRNLRAVGPFLALPVLIAAAGLATVWPWLAWPLVKVGATVAVACAVATVAVLVVALAGLAYLWWSAHQYARKRASDQMVQVSQWWFLITVWESTFLLNSGVRWALAYWLAYLAFRIVMAVGLRLRRRAGEGAPLRLLLLRVFEGQRRSERLLRQLSASWRHLGAVQMIAGPDLAAATLEPHEFLDSLRGRLNRQFVVGAEDLRRRLTQLDLGPDPDGRYRVNELFCHDDTWRPTLQELVHRSDCILLDLRGFTVARQGVTYEITQLVELVPLRRVLLLTDDTTDHDFLQAVLDTAWRGIGPTSPNWADGGALQVLQVPPRVGVNAVAVVTLLGAIASQDVSAST